MNYTTSIERAHSALSAYYRGLIRGMADDYRAALDQDPDTLLDAILFDLMCEHKARMIEELMFIIVQNTSTENRLRAAINESLLIERSGVRHAHGVLAPLSFFNLAHDCLLYDLCDQIAAMGGPCLKPTIPDAWGEAPPRLRDVVEFHRLLAVPLAQPA